MLKIKKNEKKFFFLNSQGNLNSETSQLTRNYDYSQTYRSNSYTTLKLVKPTIRKFRIIKSKVGNKLNVRASIRNSYFASLSLISVYRYINVCTMMFTYTMPKRVKYSH